MNNFIRLQELRRRRARRREEEENSSLSPVSTAVKAEDKVEKGKIKEKNTLFIDEWHDTCEFLPEDCEDVWFIFEGKLRVGFYEPQQQMFCMADGLGAELRDVRQWKYVGADRQVACYPKERQIVAVSVKDFPCLAVGIFTDHCVDPETYKEKSGVILDSDYVLTDKIVDFKNVNCWYNLVDEPLVILDPVEDSVLAVFPDEQEIIVDKTGVVLNTPAEVKEEFAVEEPSNSASDGVTPIETPKDFEEEENTEVNTEVTKDVKETDVPREEMSDRGIKSAIANYTKQEESIKMNFERLTEEQIDAVRSVLAEDKVKDWYCKEYPTDDLGKDIREDITFWDVFDCLDNYMDIYDCLGVWDSIVRERVFAKLAEIMEVDYNYIYDQYLLTKNYPFVKYSESKCNKTRKLKEDNYGWSISYDMLDEAYEQMCEAFGKEDLDAQIVDALDRTELKACLEFICRMNDFEGDFLEGYADKEDENDYDEGFDESTKEKANELKESVNLKQYHLDALPEDIKTNVVNYLYSVKK